MGTFANRDEALASLRAAGFKNYKSRNEALGDTYLEDYATIAAFLCNEQSFTSSLNHVSANLWDYYRHLREDEGNKFTKALGSMARDLGFMFQGHLKVDTPPIGIVLITGDEPNFASYVRTKLFWKDSMDSRHGEHSHSLQWLTIAYAERTQNSAADLYAKTVDYRCKSADKKEDIYLWSWLVDCFPSDMKKFAATLPNGRETLESDSFRAPQHLMDYLLVGQVGKLSDHFVAQYLYWRYKNRNWSKEVSKKDPVTYAESTSVVSIQERDIQTHGLKKHANTEWNASKNRDTGPVNSFSRAASSTDRTTPAKYMDSEAQFHGKKGVLSFRSME